MRCLAPVLWIDFGHVDAKLPDRLNEFQKLIEIAIQPRRPALIYYRVDGYRWRDIRHDRSFGTVTQGLHHGQRMMLLSVGQPEVPHDCEYVPRKKAIDPIAGSYRMTKAQATDLNLKLL